MQIFFHRCKSIFFPFCAHERLLKCIETHEHVWLITFLLFIIEFTQQNSSAARFRWKKKLETLINCRLNEMKHRSSDLTCLLPLPPCLLSNNFPFIEHLTRMREWKTKKRSRVSERMSLTNYTHAWHHGTLVTSLWCFE